MSAHLPAWYDHAACATAPAARLPWLTDTDRLSRTTVARMRAVCATCPVLDACTAYAGTAHVTGGFWAGLDRDPHASATATGPNAGRIKRQSEQLALDLTGPGRRTA